MDFFSIGDLISTGDLNAIVYLLRKFKRLNQGLRLGSLRLESNYGTFVFDKPLTSIGTNFIIENEINISSSDCLRNCFYSFVFNVIDVNTSGTVNKRIVKVTGGTGENGELSITIPTDLIESDEVLLPDFNVDIIFDEHEYYTPVSGLNVELTVDKSYVNIGETATVTATVTDDTGEPVTGLSLAFNVNGVSYTEITDSEGVAEYTYTGTGAGNVTVTVSGRSVVLFDANCLVAEFNSETVTLGHLGGHWLVTNGDVVIDWGDGSTSTVNNPTSQLTHNYNDGELDHRITFIGEVTEIGFNCFDSCTGLTSIIIPSTVTYLGEECFRECTGLTSVVIPDSVIHMSVNCFRECTGLTSVVIPDSVIGMWTCFRGCSALIDYQLYWRNDAIIPYDGRNMPNNQDAIFTIPDGETSNYISKGYPSSKIQERGGLINTNISLTGSQSVTIGDNLSLTGTLKDTGNNPLTSKTVKIYQDNTLIDTLTTDSNGEFTKTVTGLPLGSYSFKAVYEGDTTYKNSESQVLNVTVSKITTSTSITASSSSILVTESLTLTGAVTGASTGSVKLYDGATLIDTVSLSSGSYSKTLTGLTSGTHTFKAVYDGDASHSGSESSSVIVSVSKVSTSTSISASSSSILTTDTLILSGSVSNVSTGSVKIYDGATLIDTVSLSTGSYTKSLTGLTVGTHTYKTVYEGDSTHDNSESSTVTVTVSEPTPTHDYNLSVVSSKDILSYADSESATITATLTDNSSPASGETLSYTIKHGQTVIDTGSDTTDNNGQISFNYPSTGIGDVTIEVNFGILLQETYEVWDTLKYDNATLTSHNDIWNFNTFNTDLTRYDTYSAITEKVSGNTASITISDLVAPVIMDFEYMAIDGNISSTGANIYTASSGYLQYISLMNMGYTASMIGEWVKLRLIVNADSMTMVSLDDPTKTSTKTYTGTFGRIGISTGGDITEVYIRNVKIYSLI